MVDGRLSALPKARAPFPGTARPCPIRRDAGRDGSDGRGGFVTKLQCSVASAGRFRSWAATHPGAIREVNQDRFVNRPDLGVWAVADGAGGHGDGQYAAGLLAEALETLSPGLSAGELLAEVRGRIFEVHEALHQEAAQSGNPVTASTIVVLL